MKRLKEKKKFGSLSKNNHLILFIMKNFLFGNFWGTLFLLVLLSVGDLLLLTKYDFGFCFVATLF